MEQISVLRDKFNNGKPFPKAFEEYLYLAGAFNNIGFDGPETLEELQEEMKEALEAYNLKIERPWFAYDEVNWNFGFIFLDETAEDPKCYICDSENPIRDPGYTFTEIVNESIRRIKDGTF